MKMEDAKFFRDRRSTKNFLRSEAANGVSAGLKRWTENARKTCEKSAQNAPKVAQNRPI
jgi:hypothetical protein